MRILSPLLALLCALPVTVFAGQNPQVDALLRTSIFLGPNAPATLIPGRPMTYNPAEVSVLASLKSRDPKPEPRDWQDLELPPEPSVFPDSPTCPGTMHARLRRSPYEDATTIVIFPGSYATSKNGSYVNQTAHELTAHFEHAQIIEFAGFLTPEALSGTCTKIPWDTNGMAKDMYLRLAHFLKRYGANPERTGLIGFSGGASLAISILAADADSARAGVPRVFGLGGMAFSPILDGRTTFANLDTMHEQSRIPGSHGLTTADFGNLRYLAVHGVPTWKNVPALYNKNPQEFVQRFFNEFTVSDLYATLDNTGKLDHMGSYYSVYVHEGYGRENPGAGKDLDAQFDADTAMSPLLAKIDAPLLLYFSQDDPVLSSATGTGQPRVISDILEKARCNPAITVFNPMYGAHTGAVLEPFFADLIGAFFAR